MTQKVSATDLDKLTASIQGIINAYWTKMGYTHSAPPTIEVGVGQRYAKLIIVGPAERSVYGFVDLSNGDLLKAASWKAPAKHARGNLFSATPLAGCGPHGMAYITR